MLNARALIFAGGVASAVLYLVCAAAVAVAPGATTSLAGAVIHADLSSVQRSLTWSMFVGGLVFWTALGAVFFGLVAWAYTRFGRTA